MWLLLAALTALAQQPSDRWRTIETEHYRLHYPAEAEAWALDAAARLEAMRARVEDQTGLTLERPTTLVVRDPVSASNGMAFPFLRHPRAELWLTPPGASSSIGWNRRWDEGLIVHEDTHIVHLAQRARGGGDKVVDALTGFGPIGRKAPRWVTEGYATVVEGDQTGFGRPFAATDAAMVRQLATEGRLPTYGGLDGGAGWRTGSFAYSIGNAYLRWLRDRFGEDRLTDVWLRMTAAQNRSFEEAFEGVYGEAPDVLYGRFVAEVTAQAMELEQARPPREGTRWLDLQKGVDGPALSPDGSQLALVVTQGDRSVLAVWDAEPDEEEAQKSWDRKVARLLERDPVDVPARRKPEPDLGTPTQRTRKDRAPSAPRWLDDDTLVFSARTLDTSGRLRRDLFAWTVETGEERRLTRDQDVFDPAPIPDSADLLAVQQRWGVSCLARVDGATGEARCLNEARPDRVIDGPRVSPSGERVLWLEQQDGPWSLMVAPLTDDGLGEATEVAVPEGANLSAPTWHPDGTHVVLSLGLPHVFEIAAVDLQTGEVELWTRSQGGARSPALTEEHLYWLDIDAEGMDLHRSRLPGTEGAPEPEPIPPLPDAPAPAIAPTPPEVSLPDTAPVTASGYGLGRTEARFLPALQASTDEWRMTAGARLGDVVGRHELLVFAGLHRRDSTFSGGLRLAGALRALPVDVLVDGWARQGIDASRQLGVGLGLKDRVVTRTAAGGVHLGGFSATGLADAPSRYAGHARLWGRLSERTDRLVEVRASAGATAGLLESDEAGAWMTGRAGLDLFDRSMRMTVRADRALGGAPDLRLGGLQDPLLSRAAQAERILQPALPWDAAGGRAHLAMDAALGVSGVEGFFTRHTLSDAWTLDAGTSLVGVRARTSERAMPMVKLPASRLGAGVACRLEDPEAGFAERPCQSLDAWTLWLDVRWTVD